MNLSHFFLETVPHLVLVITALPTLYLCLLAVAAIRSRSTRASAQPKNRFAVVIPAHNEESVIAETVRTLKRQNYPQGLYEIHVVADHCTDQTADVARQCEVTVHERWAEPRGSKGAALDWAFRKLLPADREAEEGCRYDAAVIFDADSQVAPDFLGVMDARLQQGDAVIQGQHRISNPEDSWYAALCAAMFVVDNRFQNLGRANLGWSAKNMGDGICIRAEVLQELNLGGGLTEDYAFRQNLLLKGIAIKYEPSAVTFGEAPPSLAAARAQRLRWLRGAVDSSKHFRRTMLREGLLHGNLALLDGAIQASSLAYSSLTMIVGLCWLIDAFFALFGYSSFSLEWSILSVVLIAYPLFGLALDHAPAKYFLAILAGPMYIIWRTWLALQARFGRQPIRWTRTPHGRKTR